MAVAIYSRLTESFVCSVKTTKTATERRMSEERIWMEKYKRSSAQTFWMTWATRELAKTLYWNHKSVSEWQLPLYINGYAFKPSCSSPISPEICHSFNLFAAPMSAFQSSTTICCDRYMSAMRDWSWYKIQWNWPFNILTEQTLASRCQIQETKMSHGIWLKRMRRKYFFPFQQIQLCVFK